MDSVTGDIVTALLKANGFLVTRQLLPSGEEVLNVESSQGGVPAGMEEPTENKIIKVAEGKADLVRASLEKE